MVSPSKSPGPSWSTSLSRRPVHRPIIRGRARCGAARVITASSSVLVQCLFFLSAPPRLRSFLTCLTGFELTKPRSTACENRIDRMASVLLANDRLRFLKVLSRIRTIRPATSKLVIGDDAITFFHHRDQWIAQIVARQARSAVQQEQDFLARAIVEGTTLCRPIFTRPVTSFTFFAIAPAPPDQTAIGIDAAALNCRHMSRKPSCRKV